MPKLPGVLGYDAPAFSTYDLNEMLQEANALRPKPRGFRLNSADRINQQYGPLAYEDPNATAFAADQKQQLEAQRGQTGILSKFLIGGAANALDTVGLPGIMDPDNAVRGQTWGNALRATAWAPQDMIEGVGQAVTAPARAYRGEISDDDMIAEGLNFGGTMAIGGSVVPKGSAVARVAANATESAAPGALATEASKDLVRQMRHWINVLDSTTNPTARGAVERKLADLKAKYESAITGNQTSSSTYTPMSLPPRQLEALGMPADWKPSGVAHNQSATAPEQAATGHVTFSPRQLEALGMPPDWKPKGSTLAANTSESAAPGVLMAEAARQPRINSLFANSENSRIPGLLVGNGPAHSLDSDIARQIHEAQRLANPGADPNRLTQIEKRGPYYEVSSPVANVRAKDTPDGVQITSSRLDPDVPRGMGYGTPLYEAIANEAAAAGKSLSSDSIVSRPAQNVYSGLSRRGYDVYGPAPSAAKHPDTGQLVANEPIFTVNAPDVPPREMPPSLMPPANKYTDTEMAQNVANLEALLNNARSGDIRPGTVSSAFDPNNVLYSNSKSAAPGAMLDQGSRTAGDGSRNFVVFDDALISILRKYMNPPTAAAPGVLMLEAGKNKQ